MNSRVAIFALAMVLGLAPAIAEAATVRAPEGTELLIRFDDKLSSGTSSEGDQFSISLDDDVKARLLALNDQRISSDGVVVIKAQASRSQDMNRTDALQRLAELVRSVARPPKKRRATRPTLASKQRRLEGKSQRSAIKAGRGKVDY